MSIIRNNNSIETVSEILFNEPTAAINLETLKNSATHLLVSGSMSAARPVQHYDFLTWLKQSYEDRINDEAVLAPIHVSGRHAKRIRIDNNEIINPKDPCPIQRLNINRLVTTIQPPSGIVTSFGETLMPSISVGYNEKGIEVAIGLQAWSCANMNIFGKTRYATYGADKVSFDELKTLILNQINVMGSTSDIYHEAVEKLNQKEMNRNVQETLTAQVFEIAVDNNMRKKKEAILNISQCVKMSEEIMRKRNTQDTFTYWDFTQSGTEHLKPSEQDMISLHPTIQNFNEWVCNKADVLV